MQDSLEDYLKISRNKKEELPIKVSPQMLITAQRKKECEARAMKIVEFLIEGKLRQESFFECLKHIDQSYYQDIVEERAITKLCGYCLCNKRIPDMPKKQYHISTKNNKVYDITDRKNYCSNICYKASIHIKAQIETSPLWLRKPEDTPTFNLLPSCEKGIPGEEIDQGIIKPDKDETSFTSVSLFTEASLDEVINDEIKNKKKIKKEKGNSKLQITMTAIAEDDEDNKGGLAEIEEETQKESETITQETVDSIKKVNEIKEVEKEQTLNSTSSVQIEAKPKKVAKKTVSVDILAQIQKHVSEWITLETLIFIHGENKVKEVLNETTLADYFDKLRIADLQTSQQIRYINICRKLKLKEIADEKFDKSVNEGKLRPVPDYKQLKEESKNLDLKVRSFYSGTLHKQSDTNFPTQDKCVENEEISEPVLPTVDVNSQNVLRKKIYLESVNRAFEKLLPVLDMTKREILDDVQALVKTFSLQAHNTVFKPLVWTIIGIVLLKILSIKNEELRRNLECKHKEEYITVLLKPFPKNDTFIENILNIVNDIDAFIERYVTTNS